MNHMENFIQNIQDHNRNRVQSDIHKLKVQFPELSRLDDEDIADLYGEWSLIVSDGWTTYTQQNGDSFMRWAKSAPLDSYLTRRPSQDKLRELTDKCQCEVNIEINGHTSLYESVRNVLEDYRNAEGGELDTPLEVQEEMIKRQTMVVVRFYPRTPIGFHLVLHYDLDAALDEALRCFDT